MHRYLLAAATAVAVAAANAAPAHAVSWGSQETLTEAGAALVGIDVGADAGGDATVTWRHGWTGVPGYAERTDGFWGQPDTLGEMFTNEVRLATNAAGDAVAVWDSCTQACLYAAVREAGGAWQTPQLVSGGPSTPGGGHYDYAAAVDPDGDATIIFKRGDVISTRSRFAGESWAAAETLLAEAGASAVGLGADAAGTVFALLTANGLSGLDAKLAVRPPLGEWGAPVTVAQDVTRSMLLVAPGGDATVVSRSSEGALSSRTRHPDGTLGDPQAIVTGPVYSAGAAIGSGGHLVAFWDGEVGLTLASRPPGGAWSTPLAVTEGYEETGPVLGVDGHGNALLATQHGDGGMHGLILRTVSATGTVGPATQTLLTPNSELNPAVAVTPDGHGTVVWMAGGSGVYSVEAISTSDPIGSAGTGDGGTPDGETPDGETPADGTPSEPSPDEGGGSPPPPAPPAGPATVDTLRTVAMPKVVGRDESAAKDAVGDAGIQARFKVVLSHKKPPKGRRVGDVVLQSPKPGTQVTSGFATLLPVKLTVYGGSRPRRTKCPKKVMRSLKTGLRGADLVAAERVAEKQGCHVQRNFRIADVDEAQVTAITDTGSRRNGRPVVRLTVSVPSDVAKNDLFLGFRESPNQLSFGAEDWALTASRTQRNFLVVTVKNRTAATDPATGGLLYGVEQGTELHFDTTDVGAPSDPPVQKSDKTGQLITSVFAPKAGTIDVIAVKTGTNGLSMYGIGRLSVRDRRLKVGESFRTTGGRLLQRASGGYFCKEGPGDVCKLPFSYVKEGASASAIDPFGGFVDLLRSVLAAFAPGDSGLAAAKRELSAGRSPLATMQAVSMHRVHLMQFSLSGRPLSSAAKAIAAGGGNVIAAGGGNAIAVGGGNVIAAGGGNAIAAGGGNAIAAGGGNAIAAGGGNAIAAGGGNFIVSGAGIVTRLPGGGQAILPAGSHVVAAVGAGLWPASGAVASR